MLENPQLVEKEKKIIQFTLPVYNQTTYSEQNEFQWKHKNIKQRQQPFFDQRWCKQYFQFKFSVEK
jgi:hypothetical protein